MIRYTTPTIEVEVETDLTGNDVWFSIRQDTVRLDKKISTISVTQGVTSFDVPLTQEETAMFIAGDPVLVQVNWIDTNGVRDATGIQRISAFQNLLDKVIAYGD